MRKIMALAMAVLLSACTTIPLASIPKLRRINMLETDIAQLRIAFSVPKPFGMKQPAAYFIYNYQFEGEDKREEKLELEEIFSEAESAGLERADAPDGSVIHMFKLPASTAARLTKLRNDEVARAKTLHKKASMSYALHGEFCKTAEPAAGPIITTTFVNTSETEGWVTFTRRWNVRAEKGAEERIAKLETCG